MFALLTGIFTAYGDGNYHEHDKFKLRAFLEQPSVEDGKLNGELLGLTLEAMSTWVESEEWISHIINGVFWTDNYVPLPSPPYRIHTVNLGGGFGGTLDFSGCEGLETVQYGGGMGVTAAVTALNLSGCTSLTYLSCNAPEVTDFNISGCTKLSRLDRSASQLSSLDVSELPSLRDLVVSDNLLTALELSSNSLHSLDCSNNQLSTLDLSTSTDLTLLHCEGNPLTELTVGVSTPFPATSPDGDIRLSLPDVSGAVLRVPSGTSALYQAADGWSAFGSIVEIGSTPEPEPEPDPEPEYTLSVAPLNLSFTALSDTNTFRIESNGGWVISVGAYWLSSSVRAGSGDSTVILVARANPGTIWRSSSVTISDSGHTVTQTIHVTQSGGTFVPTSISLNHSTATLNVGESLTLTATVLPNNAENKNVAWTSDNPLVATVTDGIVTAIASGSSMITATTEVGSLPASCYVTVNQPVQQPNDDESITAIPTPTTGKRGTIEISFPVPDNTTFETSFVVNLPAGVTLDEGSSTLATDFIADYQLRISFLTTGVWLFEITCKAATYGATSNETTDTGLRAIPARKIVTVSYHTDEALPSGDHKVTINDLTANFSDGTSIQQKEIVVNIHTVSTGASLVAKDNVTVSVFGNTLTVDSPSKETLTVFTVNGTLLFQDTKEKGSTVINVSHLPRGVLIIRGSSGWTRKIIRQ
jgi:hypothetical protein